MVVWNLSYETVYIESNTYELRQQKKETGLIKDKTKKEKKKFFIQKFKLNDNIS